MRFALSLFHSKDIPENFCGLLFVMLAGDKLQKAIELGHQATALDRDKKFQEALDTYLLSIEHFMFVCKYEQNASFKQKLESKIKEYICRAEQIKDHLQKNSAPPQANPDGSGEATETGNGKSSGNAENDKLRQAMESAILTEKPNVKWDDIAGLVQAKSSLQEAVILPVKFPQLFTGKRKPWKGILLYGPPGTGKSYLAKACATEAEATFFSVSSSSLVSKWLGESEKLVKSLFDMAREEKSAIIFIDEIDSLCNSRDSGGESEASRRIKTEFLVQMEGVGKTKGSVLVLGATNCPWDLDPAIRRRFERRIYIPLPEVEARLKMFELNIGDTPHSLTRQDLRKLAETSEGYSGADISVLVRDAILQPIRKCSSATHFKRITDTSEILWTPCSPGDKDPTKKEMTLMDVQPDQLAPPVVTMDDFLNSLESMKPSVGPEDLERQREFTTNFGMEG
jgi:vacuolar protein-sorting-associated protein 4